LSKNTDLTFFTNEPGQALLDRFISTLRHVQFFDVLVGYFRTSGFHKLYESLEPVEKIRILVGLNVDRKAYELISNHNSQSELDFHSSKNTKELFNHHLKLEMENSEDNINTETGVHTFIEFLKSNKIEIKAYPRSNIHAKVYISRFNKGDRDFGRVITGSSNFSESGFINNLEFNVELKNSGDVVYALDKFEELWKDSIDLTEEYVDTIKNDTWLNDDITPYELYLKFLYEYFKEDINLDEILEDTYLPEGFKELKYQVQAVTSAKKILDVYNGVFLADVVGLGKTFISALLAQQLRGKILVICPPVLQDYWHDTFRDFGVRGFDVESHGKLDKIIRKGNQYDYVFVDEAHRFRNEVTQGYEKLHEICIRKKVILVSATPLNNTIDDFYSQLKLFQIPRRCTIPGIPNLENYFTNLKKKIAPYSKTDPEYIETIKEISKDVRDKVLKHVMVRRTRTEILKYFIDDLKEQNLTFPDINDPKRIIYKFDDDTYDAFYKTIDLIKQFLYSRYTPLLYLKKDLSEFEKQSQRNVGGFMKGILVKRLESSFYAFIKTLKRFIKSYEKFIQMYENGTVYISRELDVFEYLESDNEQELIDKVDGDKVHKYSSKEFKNDLAIHLKSDLKLLKKIKSIWGNVNNDPKLEQFIDELRSDKVLKTSKLIIFSESKETGDYLYKKLNEVFPNEVMSYSSQSGIFKDKVLNASFSQSLIKENYDPNYQTQKNDIRLLITTDVLAEGINLHKANVVINYDLPWNPTKVLQRVGRINRVGTEHNNVYIYNFFPTSESDEHLGLEANIKSKIQAFHETLGEDAKYITDEEQPSAHELFGDSLYRRLNDKKSYEGEEDEDSELKYLKILRDLRDKNPELFEKIKFLPKKARTARNYTDDRNRLITFFRTGKLKKFLITEDKESKELSFFDAVDFFECRKNTPKLKIPKDYYELLDSNKKKFDSLTSGESLERVSFRSNSNEGYILKRLKAKEMRMFKGFTDDDEELLKNAVLAFDYGMIPRKTSQTLKRLIETESNPLKVISIIRNSIPKSILETQSIEYNKNIEKKEIILSEYLHSNS